MKIIFVLWVIMIMVFSHPSKVFAATYGDKEATVVSIYDGDTFTVSIPEWPSVVSKISVRVYGVDSPEMKGKCLAESEKAVLAKTFTQLFLVGKKVSLRNIRRDKYFLLLADAYVGNKNLSDELIAAGLGRPYFGGTKQSWCL